VTVHTKDRDVGTRLSATKTVTLKVPVLVGVPVMMPVLWFSVRPNGRPVCENRSVSPSGSLADRLNGEIAVLTVLV
jgi:hypothetical protein